MESVVSVWAWYGCDVARETANAIETRDGSGRAKAFFGLESRFSMRGKSIGKRKGLGWLCRAERLGFGFFLLLLDRRALASSVSTRGRAPDKVRIDTAVPSLEARRRARVLLILRPADGSFAVHAVERGGLTRIAEPFQRRP